MGAVVVGFDAAIGGGGVDVEGVEVGADGFDGLEGLRGCGTGFEDVRFGC